MPAAHEITPEAIISHFYEVLLGRQPDAAGYASHLATLHSEGLRKVLSNFVSSIEFRNRIDLIQTPGFASLNFLGPMHVDAEASKSELDLLWNHVQQTWSKLGNDDPLWSVITDPTYHTSSRPDDAAVKSFYEGGVHDVAYCDAFLQRAGLHISQFRTLAEYGCGVGRVTGWLARRVERVKAFDISEPHLAMAKGHLRDNGVNNVDLIHVTHRGVLNNLEGIDAFFSIIVLQHNPPPIILDILRTAFEFLSTSGIAFIQIPIFHKDYKFSTERYLSERLSSNEMEMHFVPQRHVLQLAEDSGLSVLEVRNDHCIGMYRDAISSTFLLQKR